MAYFHKYPEVLAKINALLQSDEKWLILINADPDAMAGAMALKKLITKSVKLVDIASINILSRPDNIAMVKLLSISMLQFDKEMLKNYNRFAIIDSQPHHSPHFQDIKFDIIIDHHPVTEASVLDSAVNLLLPKLGTSSSLMTELLYNARIRIPKKLATALQFGIRSDTASFGRASTEVDLRAYHYLSKFAEHNLLLQILRSEYIPEWLPYFALAIEKIKKCESGNCCFLNEVKTPDMLVAIADFFQKVHGIKWVAISGVYQEKVIVIFRGNGSLDLGKIANKAFDHLGSAGGHPHMARAEMPLSNLEEIKDKEDFIIQSLAQFSKNREFKVKKK